MKKLLLVFLIFTFVFAMPVFGAGAIVTREEISETLPTVIEIAYEEGFDFNEIAELAGLTHDDVVHIIQSELLLESSDDIEWLVIQYGEDWWLHFALLHFMAYFEDESLHGGTDSAARALLMYHVIATGEISREMISDALLTATEFAREESGFDFDEIIALAGLSHYDVVDMLSEELRQDMRALIARHGEQWLAYSAFVLVEFFGEQVGRAGEDSAAQMLRTEHFIATGGEASPEEVSIALRNAIELARVYDPDFDFDEIVRLSGLTHDELVALISGMLEFSGERERQIRRYGAEWLERSIFDFIGEVWDDAQRNGPEAAALLLAASHGFIGVIDILGMDNAEEFFMTVSDVVDIVADEDVFIAAVAGGEFLSILERLVDRYGVNGFMEVFNIDTTDALWGIIEGRHVPAIAYLDEMLGGIFSDFTAFAEEIRQYEAEQNQPDSDLTDLIFDEFERLLYEFDEFERLLAGVHTHEYLFIREGDLERRDAFDPTENSVFFFDFDGEFSHRLNIAYGNRADYDATLVAFIFELADFELTDIEVKTLQIPAGTIKALQVNFENFRYMGEYPGFLAAFILSPDGIPSGEFAFRPTVYGLGHPSHR
ncbi:MAG: hypothetical protein FWC70_02800 [Defluviitaleaceae bacterium]|nr:hypothetical protein [Defluviitaleaceae bacterium]